MSVSIDEYCKNPELYDNLPMVTKTYYNQICLLKQAINRDWGKTLENIGSGAEKLALNMLESMFTPEGIALMSIFMGIDLSAKASIRAMLLAIARGVGGDVLEAASEVIAERGIMFVNNALLISVMSAAVEEGSIAARAITLIEFTSEMATWVFSVAMIVQFIGMIFDAWDPNGFSKMLDADAMDQINKLYNDAYMTQNVASLETVVDHYGRKEFGSTWPIEYYADLDIVGEYTSEYSIKQINYIMEYSFSITVNSNGYPIIWEKGGDKNQIIDNNLFGAFGRQYTMLLGNNNTIVANWLEKWWLIIIALLLIILIILIFLK